MAKTVVNLLAFCLLAAAGSALEAEPPRQEHSFAIYLAQGIDPRYVVHGTATGTTRSWSSRRWSPTPTSSPTTSCSTP